MTNTRKFGMSIDDRPHGSDGLGAPTLFAQDHRFEELSIERLNFWPSGEFGNLGARAVVIPSFDKS